MIEERFASTPETVSLDPSSVDARVGLGWASLVGRNPAEAAARWRPFIRQVADPHTLERMAALFGALGDAAAAAEARAALAGVGGGR